MAWDGVKSELCGGGKKMCCDSLLYNETVFHEIKLIRYLEGWKEDNAMSKSVDANTLITLFLSGTKWLIPVCPAPPVNNC